MHRLMSALSAALGLICKGYNVGNAYAEAPAPDFKFYMKPDDQFRQWWTEHLNNKPLDDNDVIPIRQALQGHPAVGRK